MGEELIRDPSFFNLNKGRAAADTSAAPGPLRLGASGESVKKLQRQLNDLGESLLATGQFGPRTMEAVRRFQLARGIQPASGVVDQATQRALDEVQAKGNKGLNLAPPRVADWFHSAAQRVVTQKEAPPESVQLMLEDGRSLTVEDAIEAMNVAFAKVAAGRQVDPDDLRDVNVNSVNREATKRWRKGFFTVDDRKLLGHALKLAFEALGEVDGERHDVIMIGGEATAPAVRMQGD